MVEKKDYTDFDRFIKAQVKKGTIRIDMNDKQLMEALKNLGIRRVATYDGSGRKYVNNAYPKTSQLEHVKSFMDKKQIQEKIDKSDYYFRNKKGGLQAKQNTTYGMKRYRKGQFLPKGFLND